MIIIEFLCGIAKLLVRFVFWLITARDCAHCQYSEMGLYEYECKQGCENRGYGKNRCRSTFWRKDFKRKKKKKND